MVEKWNVITATLVKISQIGQDILPSDKQEYHPNVQMSAQGKHSWMITSLSTA